MYRCMYTALQVNEFLFLRMILSSAHIVEILTGCS